MQVKIKDDIAEINEKNVKVKQINRTLDAEIETEMEAEKRAKEAESELNAKITVIDVDIKTEQNRPLQVSRGKKINRL